MNLFIAKKLNMFTCHYPEHQPKMRRQTNSSILLEALPVQKMLSSIRKAMSGEEKYYNCHPDYMTSIDGATSGKDFPENIKTALWTHIGFQGSLDEEPIRNSILEIHAIWILENYSYVYLRFIDYPEPYLDAKVANDYYTILMTVPPHVYKHYLDETVCDTHPICPSPIDIDALKKDSHNTAFRHPLNYDGTESDDECDMALEEDDGDYDADPPRIFIPEFACCSPTSSSPRAPFQEPFPVSSPV